MRYGTKGFRVKDHLALYAIWCEMRKRCYSWKNKGYKNYGGRGIRICRRWQNFDKFVADMSPRPEGLSIERKDVNGDYSPDNCCWATRKEQSRNRRDNLIFTFKGKSQCVAAWAEEYGISPLALRDRLVRCRWEVEKALTTPMRSYSRNR